MATVSYSWATDVAGFALNVVTTGNQADVAVAATAGGGYLGAWSVGSAYVRGRYVAADGTPGLEDPLNVTAQGNQFDASMALLGNGHNVVTFTDDSSGTDTVRIRILGENAVGNEVDFAVPANSRPLAGIRRHGAGVRRLRRGLHPRLRQRRHRRLRSAI